MRNPQTLSEIFLDKLKRYDLYANYEIMCIYHGLFNILDIDELESILMSAYKNRKSAEWFTQFHKTIRQCDYFQNCFRLDSDPKLNAAEMKELNKLNKELENSHKVLDKYEQVIRLMIPPVTDPTYVQKQAEHDVLYRMKDKELFPKEKHSRRYELRRNLDQKKKVSINGLLDSVLWHTIHLDKNNILGETLKECFDEFLKLKRSKKIAV